MKRLLWMGGPRGVSNNDEATVTDAGGIKDVYSVGAAIWILIMYKVGPVWSNKGSEY